MKYLKTYEKYKITDTNIRNNENLYYFKTPNNNYMVKIIPWQGQDNYYAVGFGVVDVIGYDTNIIVNENPYEIMDTVFDLMKRFSLNNIIDGFIFSLTGNKTKNEQRLKLYKRSIKKYFPTSKLEIKDGIYYIEL